MNSGIDIYLACMLSNVNQNLHVTILSAWPSRHGAVKAATRAAEGVIKLHFKDEVRSLSPALDSEPNVAPPGCIQGGTTVAVVEIMGKRAGRRKEPWYEIVRLPVSGHPLELLAGAAE